MYELIILFSKQTFYMIIDCLCIDIISLVRWTLFFSDMLKGSGKGYGKTITNYAKTMMPYTYPLLIFLFFNTY